MKNILRSVRLWWTIPSVAVAVGAYITFVRFFRGLGASTSLSDEFPWGLWIGFDMLCGVAMAAGAFTLGAIVYVFHLDHYKPLVRPAIMTGFIGYILVIIGLMYDLGHPYRIWHPLIMWNPRSVMFELSWCVTLYTTVLMLEVSTFLFERLKMQKAVSVAHGLTVPLVIASVILSMLHQSSLGSLFLVVPYKLNPLWYTPWLPVFFFASAIALGCAMVIMESFVSSVLFKRGLEIDILSDLGRVLVVVLSVYGIGRYMDLSERGALKFALEPGFEGLMFLAEILLAIVAPVALLLFWRVRQNKFGLFMGASMVVVGFILNRFNTSMTGMVRSSGVKYLPNWMEIYISFALLAFGLTMFVLAVKLLEVFPKDIPCLDDWQTCRDKVTCCLPTPAKLAIIVVWIFAFMLVFNSVREFRNYQPVKVTGSDVSIVTKDVHPAEFSKLPQDFTIPKSEDNPGDVTFSHGLHSVIQENCTACHKERFSIMGEYKDNVKNKLDWHNVRYCGECHDGKSASNECESCHKDTGVVR